MGTLSPMTVRQHARSGKLLPLAVTGNTRAPMLPDVPTFLELGYKGLDGPAWMGLFTTAGTPQPIVEKVAADVETVLAAPEIRQRMAELGLIARTARPAAFAALAKADQAYWGNVIRAHWNAVCFTHPSFNMVLFHAAFVVAQTGVLCAIAWRLEREARSTDELSALAAGIEREPGLPDA